MKTLLVGIDAACAQVLDPLLKDGTVPTLRELIDAGVESELESQIPPWTASAWPSLYTGMNPGKHGVFDFVTFDGYDWRVVDASDVRERPLWHLLDDNGFTSVVVNAPVTSPPRSFDGALIPGYMAPESPTCHPEGLLEAVREAVGGYRVYPEHTGRRETSVDAAREEYETLVRMRGEAFRYLADERDPDFGFLQFQQTDTLFHEFPGEPDLTAAVYRAVDREIERTLRACDPDTVLVVSDHGMGPYDGCECRTNELLREAGYVEATRGGGMPTWSSVRDGKLVRGEDDTEPDEGPADRAVSLAAKAGLTARRIERLLDAVGLDDVARKHAPERLVQAATDQVDFASSTAYVRSRIELGVRINLEGREPAGTVPREEYEAVRDDLVALLSSVEAPDGTPLFETVAPREEYFHGPVADEAVDVVTVPADFDHFLSAQLPGETFGEPSEPWNHKRDGLVVAAGDAVDESATPSDPHLFDVAPTVLATMDVPRGERMDGRVLPFAEPAGSRSYPSFDGETEALSERAGVEQRLADLGYLE